MEIATPNVARVPVWAWRALMAHLAPRELKRFSADPIAEVDYAIDLRYVPAGTRQQTLDVITPHAPAGPLPVYVYFHGGGWTSGDKAALTRYCAAQALGGMVVVNVNYRTAPLHRMQHIMQDGQHALAWVARNIADYGGDPHSMVLGGDSAGGQIAALLSAANSSAANSSAANSKAANSNQDLAEHYQLAGVTGLTIRGLVLHCAALDFSVMFERGFILGLGFIRMLVPAGIRGLAALRASARQLSPLEWVEPGHPPVLVTTARNDPFHGASLNFIAELRRHGVPVQAHIEDFAPHTWQQDTRHPASVSVYRRIREFVMAETSAEYAR